METPDPFLAFFQQAVNERFYNDTLNVVGDLVIILNYPDIEIHEGPSTMLVNCKKPGLTIQPDSYPLMRFLQGYPEVCEKMVRSHPRLTEMFKQGRNSMA